MCKANRVCRGGGGSQWLYGHGDPSANEFASQGKEGDFYLDIDSSTIYSKEENGWKELISIKGQEGSAGTRWFSGNGAPDDQTSTKGSSVGDYYLDAGSGNIYLKGANGWDPTGGNIKGLTGENGAAGKNGATWHFGQTPTPSEGENGDFYLDNDYNLYYKVNGQWENKGNLQGSTGPAGSIGPQGPAGDPGVAGKDGTTWFSGKGAPTAAVKGAKDGDYYLDAESGNIWIYQGSEWKDTEYSIKGEQGQPGQPGSQGPAGTPGKDGTMIYFGETAPDQAGLTPKVGDLYLKTDTFELYNYSGSEWEPLGTLIGARGSLWFKGEGDPNQLGTLEKKLAGDYYLDTKNYDIYYYDGDTWKHTGNIGGKTGEQGKPGDPGKDGATWYFGTTEPGSAASVKDAKEGDFYLNTDTYDLYVKQADGSWGGQGNIKGEAGKTWLNGEDAPKNEQGTIGDLYLNKTTGEVYLKTGESQWTNLFSIKGKDGADGKPGVDGAKWFMDQGEPSTKGDLLASAVEGDFYIDQDTYDIYRKDSSGWTNKGSLKGQRGSMIFSGAKDPSSGLVPATDLDGNTALKGDLYLYTHDDKVDLYRYDGSKWDSIGTLTGETGADGKRGSMTFFGTSKPAEYTYGVDLQEGDLYLYNHDSKTTLYRYDDHNEWKEVADLTGATGAQGTAGQDGKDGATTFFGTEDPNNGSPDYGDETPKLGDIYFYTNEVEGSITIYRHTGTTWQSIGAIKNGANGKDGAAGKDGATWYFGQDDVGIHSFGDVEPKVGDFYLNTSTYHVFVKTADKWDDRGSIKGEVGTIWYSGSGNPNDKAGTLGFTPKDHDYYLDTDTNNVWRYSYSEKTWQYVSNISGTRGASWFVGDGTIDVSGKLTDATLEAQHVTFLPGDFYLQTTGTLDVYRYSGEKWEKVGSLKGEQGVQGERGTSWFSSVGKPNDSTFKDQAKDGDLYLDTTTGDIYKRESGAWQNTNQNIRGPKGEKGTVWFVDSGAPSTHDSDSLASAVEGDFYLDSESGEIYVKQHDGTWSKSADITGPQGPQGRNPWPTVLSSGEPPKEDSEGKYEVGDFYIDLSTHKLYQLRQKEGTALTWTELFDMQGPQGVRGTKWHVAGTTTEGAGKEPATYFTENEEAYKDLLKGDVFLNSVDGKIWTYTGEDKNAADAKDSSKWTAGGSIKGAPGRAARWYIGDKDPQTYASEHIEEEIKDAQDGDMYLDVSTGDVYKHTTSGWDTKASGNIRGPQGSRWYALETGDPTEEESLWDSKLKDALKNANVYDIFYNTTSGVVYQYQYKGGSVGAELEWVKISQVARGTRWFYGYGDPTQEGAADLPKDAQEGDFYFQGYSPFTGYSGFRVFVLQNIGGKDEWTLLVDMRSEESLTRNTYYIRNYAELVALRDAVKDNHDYAGKAIVVIADIEIPAGVEWEPIGSEGHPFKGTFAGGRPTKGELHDEYTSELRTISGVKNGTLFAYTNSAEIKNINVSGSFDDPTEANAFLGSVLTDPSKVLASNASGGLTLTPAKAEYSLNGATLTVTSDGSSNVTVELKGTATSSVALYSETQYQSKFNDVKFVLAKDVTYKFDTLKFTGDSYIDLTAANKSVTIHNCYADVDPSKVTGRPAFIIGQETSKGNENPLELTVTNNTFLTAQSTADHFSTAIFVWTPISKAVIEGNTFGADSDEERYTFTAVKFLGFAGKADITFKNNEVYGTNKSFEFSAFDLCQGIYDCGSSHASEWGAQPYTVKFDSNTVNVTASHATNKYYFLDLEAAKNNATVHAQVYFLGEDNKLVVNDDAGTANLYNAVIIERNNAGDHVGKYDYDFIAFNAALNEAGDKLTAGKVYLGANFGAEHTDFAPDELEKIVKEDVPGTVWIIDIAFADPLGFVQHVADYSTNYYVTNADGLGYFRDMVNGMNSYKDNPQEFEGKIVATTQDIDLKGIDWIPISGTGCTPLKDNRYYQYTTYFKGTFTTKYNEVQYAIKNLKIDRSGANYYDMFDPSNPDGKYMNLGLFGYVNKAKLHDITLTNVTIKTDNSGSADAATYGIHSSVGALVGYTNSVSSYENITVNGLIDIEAKYYVQIGGVFGWIEGGNLTNVKLEAEVGSKVVSAGGGISGYFVGGILGHQDGGGTYKDLTVKNITLEGYRNVGGLIGVTTGTITGATLDDVTIQINPVANESDAFVSRFSKNVGAVVASLGSAGAKIEISKVNATDVTFVRTAKNYNSWGLPTYIAKSVWNNGYIGGIYNVGVDDPEETFKNITIGEDCHLTAKIDDGLYIVDGVYEIRAAIGLQRFADMVTKTQSIDSFNKSDFRPDTTGVLVKLLVDVDVDKDLKDAEGNWLKNDYVGTNEHNTAYEYSLDSIGSAGRTYDAAPFKGTFDGGTHTITGLTSALFASTNGATIKNLTLSDINISGASNVGGLVGEMTGGTIENVTVNNVTIVGVNMLGGVVGYAHNSARLTNVNVNGVTITETTDSALSGTDGVGGIVGRLYQSSMTNSTVQGTIKIEGNVDVGGVAGRSEYSQLTIVKVLAAEDSESYVLHGHTASSSDVIGGIAGYTSEGPSNSFSELTVQNIKVSGTVVGGLFGILQSGASVDRANMVNVTVNMHGGWNDFHSKYIGAQGGTGFNIGAVAGTGNGSSEIKVSNISFTGELLREPNVYGRISSNYVWNDGYVGCEYNKYTKFEHVTFDGDNHLYAKLADGFFIRDGVLEISNENGLVEFSNMFETVGTTYQPSAEESKQLKAILTESITMNAETKWTPITNSSAKTPYAGEFDGQGNSITGLKGSLFGLTNGANIHNLKLEGVAINSESANVGAVVGEATDTKINAVTVDGKVSGTYNVGGVVGAAHGNTTITDAIVKGTITKTDTTDAQHARSIGAIVGAADGTLTLGAVSLNVGSKLDNRYSDGNLNYLVYNYGLVGSALGGEATDSWASGKSVYPAAKFTVEAAGATGENATVGGKEFTAATNALIEATDLNLTATYFPTGAESKPNPVIVTVKSAKGLDSVSKLVNGGVSFEGETIMQGKPISMMDYEATKSAWTPIGTATHPFKGQFTGSSIGHLYGSLFGYTDGATIQNLTLGNQAMQPLDGSTAASGCAALVKDGSATISNVTIKGFGQDLNGNINVDPGSVAKAPFGITGKADDFTFSSVSITLKFGDITFHAEYNNEGKVTEPVTYIGKEAEAASASQDASNTINDGQFVLGAASYEFKNIKFTGNSFIDAKGLTGEHSLTIDGIYAEVTSENFITDSKEGIAASSFTLTNSTIIDVGNSLARAIYSWKYYESITIKGNTFGSAEHPYYNHAVKIMGNANNAVYNISDNEAWVNGSKDKDKHTVYAFDLYQHTAAKDSYTAYLSGNTVHGPDRSVETTMEGSENFLRVRCDAEETLGQATVYLLAGEPGNTYNGKPVTYENITTTEKEKGSFGTFVGYDVTFEGDGTEYKEEGGKITAGHFIYSSSWETAARTPVDGKYDAQLKDLVAGEGYYGNVWVEDGTGSRYNLNYNYLTRLISTVDELKAFRDEVNAGNDFAGITVILWREGDDYKNDVLTVSDTDTDNGVFDLKDEPWTPIGDSKTHTFKGTFDGRGYIIENLTITQETAGNGLGLFGYVVGEIKNLTLNNVAITAKEWEGYDAQYGHIGAVAGDLTGSIHDVTLGGTININGVYPEDNKSYGSAWVGGVVGHANLTSKTYNIKVKAEAGSEVVGGQKVGGVFGFVYESTDAETEFEDITSNLNVRAYTHEVGGFTGAFYLEGGKPITFKLTDVVITADVVLADGGAKVAAEHGKQSPNDAWSADQLKQLSTRIGGFAGASNSGSTIDFVSGNKFEGHLYNLTPKKDEWTNNGLIGSENSFTINGKDDATKVDINVLIDGENFTFHNGEYEVNNVDGLKAFRDRVNGVNAAQEEFTYWKDVKYVSNDFKGKTVKLTAKEYDLGNEPWTPIGGTKFHTEVVGKDVKNVCDNPFRGVFDGQNKTIKNLTVDLTGRDEKDYGGLFGLATDDALLKAVNIVNADIKGSGYLGALAGQVYTGGVEDVNVTSVTIEGNHYIGGVFGHGYAYVHGCTVNTADLTATPNETSKGLDNGDKIGGIVGWNNDSAGTEKIVGNTVTNVTLRGYRDIGGIVGYSKGAEIKDNTVQGVTITVDQIKNNYGDKATNAGFIIGRADSDTDALAYHMTINNNNNQIITEGYEYSLTYNIKGSTALQSALNEATEYGPTTINLAEDTYTGTSSVAINSNNFTGFTILGNTRNAKYDGKTYTRTIKGLTINGGEGVEFKTPIVMYDTTAADDSQTYLTRLDVDGLTVSGLSFTDIDYSIYFYSVNSKSRWNGIKFESNTFTWNGEITAYEASKVAITVYSENSAVEDGKHEWFNTNVTINKNVFNNAEHATLLHNLSGLEFTNNTVNEFYSLAVSLQGEAAGGKVNISGNKFLDPKHTLDPAVNIVCAARFFGDLTFANNEIYGITANNKTTTNGKFAIIAFESEGSTGKVKTSDNAWFAADTLEEAESASKYALVETEATCTGATYAWYLELAISSLNKTDNGYAGLATFRDDVNAGNGTYFTESLRVNLTAESIDLNNEPWTPIGTSDNPFKGWFNGGYNYGEKTGTCISNLTVTGASHLGLFGYASNATLENIKIDTATLTGGDNGDDGSGSIGALLGSAIPGATIKNIEVCNVTITGARQMGGIVGQMYGDISYSRAINVEITATPNQKADGNYDNGDKIGGIIGYLRESADYHIENCEAESITLNGYRDIGGIVGAFHSESVGGGKTHHAHITGNTVKGVKITVDQVTNSYGDKETNAGFIYGRNIEGTISKEYVSNNTVEEGYEYSLTYKLSQGGKALQSALNEAEAYGSTTINLAEGTYTGTSSVEINGSTFTGFTILGNTRNAKYDGKTYTRTIKGLTINGGKGVEFKTPIVMYDTVESQANAECLNVNGLTVKGLTFNNVDNPIYFYDNNLNSEWSGFTFEGNSFSWDDAVNATDLTHNGIHLYSESGSRAVTEPFFIKNVTVKDSKFNNTDYAIYAHNVNGLTVEGNDFNTYFHAAIGAQGVSRGNVVISENSAWNSRAPHDGSGFVRGSSYLGGKLEDGTMAITNNKFYGNAANPDEETNNNEENKDKKQQILVNFAKEFNGTLNTSGNTWYNAESPKAAKDKTGYAIIEVNESLNKTAEHDHAYHWHLEIAISSLDVTDNGYAGLAQFRDDVNAGNGTYFTESLRVNLTAESIDLGSIDNWEAIGTDAHPFNGWFDGNNHTISGLTSSGKYAGLFGYASGRPTIENLTISGANLTEQINNNEAYAGAVVAKIQVSTDSTTAKLSNLHVVDVTIDTAYRYAGGIVGQSYVSIYNCSAKNVEIEAHPNNDGDNYDNGDKIGGITGWFVDDTTREISGNTAENITITAYRDAGGIAGYVGKGNATGNTVKGVKITIDQITNFYSDKETNAGYIFGRAADTSKWVEYVANNTVQEGEGYDYSLTYNIKGSVALQYALNEAEAYGSTTINLAAGTYEYTDKKEVTGPSGNMVKGFNIDPNGRTSKDGVRTIKGLTIQKKADEKGDVTFKSSIMMFTGASSSIAVDGLKVSGITSVDVSRLIYFHNNNKDKTNQWKNFTFDDLDISFTNRQTDTKNPNVGIYVYLEDGSMQTRQDWSNFDVTVSNSKITKTTYALYMHNLNGLTVTDNTFEEYYYYAVGLQGEATGGNIVVKNNKFVGNNWSINNEGLLRGSNLFGNLEFTNNDLYGYAANKDTSDANKQLILNLGDGFQGSINATGNRWHAQEAIDGESSIYAVYERVEDVNKTTGGYKYHLELAISSLENNGNLAGLETWRKDVNEGGDVSNYFTPALPVRLTNDIDLGGSEWKPIGSGHDFKGVFDGNNYTIKNLSIQGANHDGLGLFGYVHGTLKNFTIENVNIVAKEHGFMGGAVGSINGYVENVHVTGSIHVEGKQFVAGVIGYMYGNSNNLSAIKTPVAVAASLDDSKALKGVTFDIIADGEKGESAGGIIGYIGEGGFTTGNLVVENLNVYANKAAGGAIGNINTNVTVNGAKANNVYVAADNDSSGIILGTTQSGDRLTNYEWSESAVWRWDEHTEGEGMWYRRSDASVVAPQNWDGQDVTNTGEIAPSEEQIHSAWLAWLNEELTIVTDETGLAKIYKGKSETALAIRYEVSSAAGLVALAKAWNEGKITPDLFVDGQIVIELAKNIDMTTGAENFAPIGTGSQPFTGTFDGKGHKIFNLNITQNDERGAGLFGYAGKATIKNLTIENCTIQGKDGIGAFVGVASGTLSLSELHLIGKINITGNYQIGGIIGEAYYTTATNCSVKGTGFIVGKYINTAENLEGDNIGGLIGFIDGTYTFDGLEVEGINIEGTRKVGGVIGYMNGVTLKNSSYKNGTVKCNADEAYTKQNAGKLFIGGLIGEANSKNTIEGCSIENVTLEAKEFHAISGSNAAAVIVGGSRSDNPALTYTNNTYKNVTVTLHLTNADKTDYMPLELALTALNMLTEKEGLASATIHLSEGVYSPTAGDKFKITVDNVHLVGADKGEGGEYKTVINTKEYHCSTMAGFIISGHNCSVSKIKFVTESTNNNIAAIKVTQLNQGGDENIRNIKITDVEIVGNLGHALNIHGVDGITLDKVTIGKHGKCGISIARATGVLIKNTTFLEQEGGWDYDMGIMYTEGEAAYSKHSEVTIDFSSCIFAKNAIYSERPQNAPDGADKIYNGTSLDGHKEINSKNSLEGWDFTEKSGWTLKKS